MVIVLVIDTFEGSAKGAPLAAQNLRRALTEAGHEVRVVSCDHMDSMFRVKKRWIPYMSFMAKFQRISYSKKELKAAKKDEKKVKDRSAIDNAPVVTKMFDVLKIRGISADYGKRFELTEASGLINRFIPENGQSILKMQMAIQCMQELAAKS